MRILTRYLLRLHVAPFLFALTGLTLLLLLDQVSKRFGRLVGKGLEWTVIAEVFYLSIPFIVAQTLPMAVLVAVLYVFNRLAGDNEITAIKASGIPLAQLLVPLAGVGVVLAAGMALFNNTVLPESNHRLSVLLSSIGQKKPTFVLREQAVNEVLPGKLYLQVARIDHVSHRLDDVTIFDERQTDRSRTIYADSGRMATGPEGTDLYLTLRDGVMQERQAESPAAFQRIHFASLIMRVPDVTNELERNDLGGWRDERSMTIAQLDTERQRGLETQERARRDSRAYAVALVRTLAGGATTTELVADEDTLMASAAARSATRLRQPDNAAQQFTTYQTQIESGHAAANRYGVEIQKKYSIPAACIVFVLIGAPIAVRYPRAGVGLVVGVSLAFFCAYYVALVGGEELAGNRILSPFWAMWAPNVLFGFVGLGLVWRVTRAGR